MSKSSYTPEFRAKIAQEYLNGNCSRKDSSKKYNIPESTIRDWINVYKTHGINAFINTNGNKQYTKDFKIQCVEAVLKGESLYLTLFHSIKYQVHICYGNGFRCIMLIENLRIIFRKGRSIWQTHEEKQPLKNVRKS